MTSGLEGKVAVVTGAAHGIGRTYALALAERGAAVVAADLDGGAATAVAKEIEDGVGNAIATETNVTDSSSLAEMADAATSSFGRIDILINNAAIFSREWDQVLDVNLKGVWLACRAVVPTMRSSGYGKIVNVSSTTVFQGLPTRAHYVASKAGVIGLTRTLAAELGPAGVTVNCIAPGSTLSEDDPSDDQVELRQRASMKRAIPRVQVPEDLVGSVVFLASPDSDFITGQTLVVDGGTVML